jgi:hypothetical protein
MNIQVEIDELLLLGSLNAAILDLNVLDCDLLEVVEKLLQLADSGSTFVILHANTFAKSEYLSIG